MWLKCLDSVIVIINYFQNNANLSTNEIISEKFIADLPFSNHVYSPFPQFQLVWLLGLVSIQSYVSGRQCQFWNTRRMTISPSSFWRLRMARRVMRFTCQNLSRVSVMVGWAVMGRCQTGETVTFLLILLMGGIMAIQWTWILGLRGTLRSATFVRVQKDIRLPRQSYDIINRAVRGYS